MARGSSKPEAVAVLDVGKTNVKLLAVAPDGKILSSRSAPNAVRRGEPYPHCDTEHIWRWMMAALADLGERFAIEAIVPTGYGSTAALVADDALVLPIMDYEAEPPAAIAAAYAEVAPWFEECCCPIHPAGLTLARQLFWQSRAFPEDFRRARWILPFAQYWSWGLVRRAGERGDLARRPDPALEPARARSLDARQGRGLGRDAAAAALRLGRARPAAARGRREVPPAGRTPRCCAASTTATPTMPAISPPGSTTSP